MFTNLKMSRELRLAYICHRLHMRMQAGKGGRVTWYRHFNMTVLLDKEKEFNHGNIFGRRVA